jgi:hypothetical protein
VRSGRKPRSTHSSPCIPSSKTEVNELRATHSAMANASVHCQRRFNGGLNPSGGWGDGGRGSELQGNLMASSLEGTKSCTQLGSTLLPAFVEHFSHRWQDSPATRVTCCPQSLDIITVVIITAVGALLFEVESQLPLALDIGLSLNFFVERMEPVRDFHGEERAALEQEISGQSRQLVVAELPGDPVALHGEGLLDEVPNTRSIASRSSPPSNSASSVLERNECASTLFHGTQYSLVVSPPLSTRRTKTTVSRGMSAGQCSVVLTHLRCALVHRWASRSVMRTNAQRDPSVSSGVVPTS